MRTFLSQPYTRHVLNFLERLKVSTRCDSSTKVKDSPVYNDEKQCQFSSEYRISRLRGSIEKGSIDTRWTDRESALGTEIQSAIGREMGRSVAERGKRHIRDIIMPGRSCVPIYNRMISR